MGLFDFLKSKTEEDVEKGLFYWDEHDLEKLNDEELDTEFRYLSAMFSRTLEGADMLLERMEERGNAMPSGTALYKACLALKGYDEAQKILEMSNKKDKYKSTDIVKGRGKKGALVAFVGSSPSMLDVAREKVFAGQIGSIMKSTYLPSLDMDEDDVYFTNLVPEYLEDEDGSPREPTSEEIEFWSDSFKEEIRKAGPRFIVALGKNAADALGNMADEWVPHPRAVQMYGDSGEVGRKLSRLAKNIESWTKNPDSTVEAKIAKTDDELRVVYGVVLEPEVEDTDGNWTTEEEIIKACHYWMQNSRVIGDEHIYKATDVEVVECWIAPEDTVIGQEEVKKGSWILGVKVHDNERWELVKSGEYSGFSIAGAAIIDETERL